MTRVVLDTNILVSALWSKDGNAAKIPDMFIRGELPLFYDARILAEYKAVLSRPKFAFRHAKVGLLINKIRDDGIAVVPAPCDLEFADEADKKFYEVAKDCNALLITGNLRHCPGEPFIQSTARFLK
ncbi:MAG: putative toxin-antitoxin system toxin component, PIN family [Clostridiales Family XIII bacterium]|jgi:putative PIN family toxin of toxin-antitoxin system|nr:putative toxin-antitoxin system toxin component, PIN family [Clostridiales Family XIII bacterium]